ncbi:hypothetical protein SAY86_001603 [Trapa natans]|uniref:PGG domain-containing protein n=1 Tax=Trapa natans TaxID=22666 RepID=A0AAN7LHT0_TRANT|nr:hypothetical protein SAY86_001603 [Trapa natans]
MHMESKLSEAARTGDVSALLDLLQQDPLILDKIIILCLSETPLHTAAMLGHVKFVRELLNRRPELAIELDSDGNSPLHLASAKGHTEVVRDILRANPAMGKVRNLDGRTPLHMAVIKGRTEVIAQMVQDAPELIRVLTDRGESSMHLCVLKNRKEALKVVIEQVIGKEGGGEEGDRLVNWADWDGNTAMHIAVAKRQVEIVRLLLDIPGLNANVQNRNGFTPLDILMQGPRDLNDLEIEGCLLQAGARHADIREVSSGAYHHHDTLVKKPWTRRRMLLQTGGSGGSVKTPLPLEKKKHAIDWLGRKRSALMVVASLLATVAFQAAITPTGGLWQDDLTVDANGQPAQNAHKAGTAIMAYSQKTEYGFYMISNTVAFLASLSIILLLVSGLPMKKRRWMWLQMVIMWIAITAQVVTYFLSLRYMSPKDASGRLKDVTEISVLSWLCLMVVVLLGNIARVNLWILRKYGYLEKKEETKVPSIKLGDRQHEGDEV